MKKFVLVLLILALIPTLTHAGWWRTYGGNRGDGGTHVEQTDDGGYITVGYRGFISDGWGNDSSNIWLLKTDSNGDTTWTQTYGGESIDLGSCVQQTSDGGYIVLGTTYSFGNGACDIWLLKTNENGDTVWTRTYGGEKGDAGEFVQQTLDGGYIISGRTASYGAGECDIWLIKTDAEGEITWDQIYGGTDYETSNYVTQTPDGGYSIIGNTKSFDSGYYDIWLLKTDSLGDTVWTRTYWKELSDCSNYGHQTSDGGYIIIGSITSIEGPGDFDVFLFKTNENGDSVWVRRYISEMDAHCIQETHDGGYIFVMNRWGSYGGDYICLIKTDENGNESWEQQFRREANDRGYCIQQTLDRGYVITGRTESFVLGSKDLILVKTDSLGNLAIEEPPTPATQPDWHITTPIGRTITLRAPEGTGTIDLAVFDASGRQVDEIRLASGNLIWGQGQPTGVYFIREVSGSSTTNKVVLVR